MASNLTPPQSFDLSPIDRLERLVNNDQFADVAFQVGAGAGELMFGHKAILAEASEVFRAQFSGAFRESRDNVREHAIPIVDIEPAPFKELLRYMYCNRVNVTMDNVLPILYGANKYLLMKLKKGCESCLLVNLSERNVLELFDQNRRFELEEINQLCLDIICDNPIKIFAEKSFLTLARKSLEMIAKRQLMNCQTTQLLTAIGNWIKANKGESKEGTKIIAMVREQTNRDFKCKKMHNFSAGHYVFSTTTFNVVTAAPRVQLRPPLPSPKPVENAPVAIIKPLKVDFELHIASNWQFSIYGFGICIKAQRALNPITLDVTVVVRTERGVQIGQSFATKRTVKPNDKFCVEEILFEKITIDQASKCTITVELEHGCEALFCFKNFESELPNFGSRITSRYGMRNKLLPQPNTNCIVSYVLYNTVVLNRTIVLSE